MIPGPPWAKLHLPRAGVFIWMIRMKIDFEFQTIHGMYRDALHLADDHTFTEDEIQSMKQQRLDTWFAFLTAASSDANVIDVDAQFIDVIEDVIEDVVDVTPIPEA